MAALATLLDTRFSALTDSLDRTPKLEAYRAFVAGQRYFWSEQHDSAEILFRRAMTLDSEFLSPAPWLATIYRGKGQCRPVDSIVSAAGTGSTRMADFDRFILGRQVAACRGDAQEAADLARRMVARYPGSSFSWYILGRYALGADRPHEALAALDHLDPAHDLGWDQGAAHSSWFNVRAVAQMEIGDYAGALATSQTYLAARGAATGPLMLVAAALVRLRRDGEALKTARAILTAPVDSSVITYETYPPALVLLVARDFAMRGDTAMAHQSADLALTGAAERPPPATAETLTRLTRIRALEALEEYPAALTAADSLIRERPADWIAAGERGLLLAHLGQTDSALSIASRLTDELDINCAGGGPFMKARILTALGRRQEAVTALRRVADRAMRECISVRREAMREPEFRPLVGYGPYDSLMQMKD
jgi:tetratricopeptide (TPR) repeat protein